MEKQVETVTITHQGKQSTWVVCEDSERYEGRRAYLRGTAKYYELATFEAGLANADSFQRTPA